MRASNKPLANTSAGSPATAGRRPTGTRVLACIAVVAALLLGLSFTGTPIEHAPRTSGAWMSRHAASSSSAARAALASPPSWFGDLEGAPLDRLAKAEVAEPPSKTGSPARSADVDDAGTAGREIPGSNTVTTPAADVTAPAPAKPGPNSPVGVPRAAAQDSDYDDCLSCHDKGVSGSAAHKVDFVEPKVDPTVCRTCHWISMGDGVFSSFTHGHADGVAPRNGPNCGKCHPAWMGGWSADLTRLPVQGTEHGFFADSSSPSATVPSIHALHVNGSWPKDLNPGPDYPNSCRSCHGPARCDTCHADPDPATHREHTRNKTTGQYAAGQGPVTYHTGAGTVPGRGDQVNFPETVSTCVNDACHSLSKAGDVATFEPTCRSCHPDPLVFHAYDTPRHATDLTAAVGATDAAACMGCHNMDLMTEHARYSLNCATCHSSTDPAVTGAIVAGDTFCLTCHDGAPMHPDLPPVHTSSNGADFISGGIDWDGHSLGDGEYMSCSDCHTLSLLPLHANYCTPCHSPNARAAVKNAVATNNTSCTTCHPGQHDDSYIPAHDSNGWECGSCHGNGCTQCHSTWVPVPHPATTSDVQPSYVGDSVINLYATDAVNGSFGIRATYYSLDGSSTRTGTQVSVSAPPVGTQGHTLSFWSVDWTGNVEAPPNVVTFNVSHDSWPPTTTANVVANNVYVGDTTFALTPADANSTIAGTWWQLDGTGGPWTSGTQVPVAGPEWAPTTHTLYYYSADSAGNTETVRSVDFGVSPGAEFASKGATQTYVVPSGVITMSVTLNGGAGGDDYYAPLYGPVYGLGGRGGRVSMLVTVTPAATYTLLVGGAGSTTGYYNAPGGWPNGARGNSYLAGGGGGSSSIWLGSTEIAEAGGGGGAGYYYAGRDGGSGGAQGTLPGGLKTGTISSYAYTGGGGGGWNAGLGGAANYRGGTGGTSYVAVGTGTLTAGANPGNGSITIRYSKPSPDGPFMLMYGAGANGSISGISPQTVAKGANGTTVTAVPNANYHFVNWTDGSTANPRQDTSVSVSKSVLANFAIDAYKLTYAPAAHGSISGATSQTVSHGSSGTTVTAIADTNYHFVTWSDGSTANPRRDTNVTATLTVTANFEMNLPVTLRYAAGAHGTISGATSQAVPYGANGTTVTAVPDPSYHFVAWSDGKTVNPRQDTSVSVNTSVTASFTINTYPINAYSGIGGSVSPAGTSTVDEGGNRTYTIAAASGYTINDVLVDGVSQGAIASYAFSGVAATHTIIGTFSGVGAETTQATSADGSGYVAWVDAAHGTPGEWGVFNIYADDVLIGTKPATGDPTWQCPETPISSGGHVDIVLDVGFEEPFDLYDSSRPIQYTFTLPAGSTALKAATWTGFNDLSSGIGNDGDEWGYPDWEYSWVALWGSNITNIVWASGTPTEYALVYASGSGGTIAGASPQFVRSGASGTTVTAVAAPGQHFVDWSDGSVANPRRDTNVTGNRSVTASFAAGNLYTRTYAAGANGSVVGTSPQYIVQGSAGTTVTAVATTGYHFASWSDGVTTNPRRDTNVQASLTATATFAINTYTLTYTPGPNGTVTGTSPQTVSHGSSGTTVTAVANTGSHFVNWSDGSTANPRRDTNVTATRTVTANFIVNGPVPVTYLAGAHGSIVGTTPQTVIWGNSSTPVTATADSGYHFVDWSDGRTSNPRVDASVTSTITVTANFSVNESHTVTYLAGAHGSISGTTPQSVAWQGSGTAVTAVPDTGYRFVNWSDGSTANPRQDANVTTTLSVTANFTIQTFQMYSTYFAGGTISPLGYLYPNYGSTVTYTVSPNAGYRVACFRTDNDYVNGWRLPAATYTFSNITANHAIYAYFAGSGTRTLVYTYGVNGYTDAYTTPANITIGSNGPTVTPIPYGGYHFVNWSDGSTANPRKDLNVTEDKIITPVFAPNTYTLAYTAGANGSIAGSSTQSLLYGSTGSAVTAVADAGYRFINWSDGGTAETRSDYVGGNLSVSAVFAPSNVFRLVYLASGPGGLAGPTIQTVAAGGSASVVTAEWDSYYNQFDGWSDGRLTAARQDTNISADATYTANFSQWYFGSCPFLFTWNGTEYEYEADLFTTGKIASQRAGGTYQKPNPNDYYVLRTEPALVGGQIEAKLVEERIETDYLDRLQLYAIDVPEGSDIAAKKIPQGGGYQPLEDVVHSVASRMSTVSATQVSSGADMSAELARADGQCAELSPDPEQPAYDSVELDLGDLSGAPAVKLVVEGATRFPKTDEGKLLGTAGVRQRVEVIGADGKWTALPGEWPKPAEFGRPYLLDLTGRFPTSDHRVRLTFLLKTYIDSVRLDTTDDVPLRVTEVPLTAAQLGRHGLDPLVPFGDLVKFAYGPPEEFFGYLTGWYTRFGDVTPLLSTTDDKFVIFGGGDELTLHFADPEPPPKGMVRRFVLYTKGYYKDLNTDVAHTVEPLPFGAMSNYPYPVTESYPTDADHVQYRQEWNTRYEVGR